MWIMTFGENCVTAGHAGTICASGEHSANDHVVALLYSSHHHHTADSLRQLVGVILQGEIFSSSYSSK